MKAFLLAAGLGTRLSPITDGIPKCLVPVKGHAMLYWWIQLFKKHGITDVLINTHSFHDMIEYYLRHNSDGINFTVVNEPELLGSAGTLWKNIDFVADSDDPFFVCYADVLTNCDLSDMYNYHKAGFYPLTIGATKVDDIRGKGIITRNTRNVIVSFEEKPTTSTSRLANAGIYVMDKVVIDRGFDIARDILPEWVSFSRVFFIDDYLIDIGTPDDLKKANEEFQGI